MRCQSLLLLIMNLFVLGACGGGNSSPPDIDTLEDLAGFYTVDSSIFLSAQDAMNIDHSSDDDSVENSSGDLSSNDFNDLVIEITEAGTLYLYQLNNTSETLSCVLSSRQQQLSALGEQIFLFENLQDDFAPNQRYEVTRDLESLVLTNILDPAEIVQISPTTDLNFLNDVCVYRIVRTETFQDILTDLSLNELQTADADVRETFILDSSFQQTPDFLELYFYNAFGDVNQVERYDLINDVLLELESREYNFEGDELVSHRTFNETILNRLVVQDDERIFEWEAGLTLGYDRTVTQYDGSEVTQEISEEYINVYSDDDNLIDSQILRTESEEYIQTEYLRDDGLLQSVNFLNADGSLIYTIRYNRDDLGRVIGSVMEELSVDINDVRQEVSMYDYIQTTSEGIVLSILKYDDVGMDDGNTEQENNIDLLDLLVDLEVQYYELSDDCGRFYPVSQAGVSDQINTNRDCFSMNVEFLR